jgi:hypothetical protein
MELLKLAEFRLYFLGVLVQTYFNFTEMILTLVAFWLFQLLRLEHFHNEIL